MKKLFLIAALMLFPQEPMVAPKVEHHERKETQTYDDVTRSCPAGYEGHFVDIQQGFDWRYWDGGGYVFSGFPSAGSAPAYTVCFKKEFMDEIRKNPELLIPRPQPPHGV